MKRFEINSKSGINFVVGINEDPNVRKHLDSYTKELNIVYLSVDGAEVPNLFLTEFAHKTHEGEEKLIIRINYNAFEFIKKLKKLPAKQKYALILCNDELTNYYNNVFLPTADAKIERLKAEETAAIQAAFEALTDDSILKINYSTSYGFAVQGKAGGHEYFENVLPEIKKASIEIPDTYQTDFDWGDYSTTTYYEIPFGEIKRLYQAARDILEPIEKKAAEEKAAKKARETALKAAVKCEVVRRGQSRGEELDPYAVVRLANPQTGESLEFTCRNIFDVGYVINPNYAIAEGIKGGLARNDKWQGFGDGKGWYDVRELTEFEKLCLEYLRTFPPVCNGIRM